MHERRPGGITGESPPFYAAIVARLADAAPQARVTTLQGAGHAPHFTHPAEWLEIVTRFAGEAG